MKNNFERTNKNNYIKQLSEIEQRIQNLKKIEERINNASKTAETPSNSEDKLADEPTKHYQIGISQKEYFYLGQWLLAHQNDPAIKVHFPLKQKWCLIFFLRRRTSMLACLTIYMRAAREWITTATKWHSRSSESQSS